MKVTLRPPKSIKKGLKFKGKKSKKITMAPNSTKTYSPKKISAKFTPPNSVLKPETSSDSDSLKSNGARCVSDKTQIIQIGIKINANKLDLFLSFAKLKLPKKASIKRIIVLKTASYEID
jgi:hypothetical protein